MSRRIRPEKREIEPDLRYGNVHVSMFVNRLMYDGKKSVAQSLIYDSFDMIEERVGRPGVEVFEQALQNVSPQVEVRPRRVGGATYQVPVPVDSYRQLSLAMRWLLTAARNRGGQTMADKLANEFVDASNNQGAAVKKRDDTHRMAEANRAFSHFRA
ncbi:MAG TPA: 30S ribosomal protein S7 [Promineifilum sp.]|nr:30S ribosomal protein S7 [Thermomicrobiales bacterium]HRN69434.1 30S ribosomal protein S7 [Promineifilum sp.]HRO90797.1 30S ribosomal protein S7 [Promineifilum sp.]HRQ15093.1 30S ribosomal protein S7 [Promineifilum sp.]